MAGATTAGFTAKTVTDLLADIGTAELANVDPALDLSPASPIGQLNGVFAAKLAELWELAGTAYNAFNPDAAEGFLQDSLCALTGTLRLAASPSKCVAVTVNLNAGVTLPAGSIANVAGQPATRFVSAAPVTNSGGSPANVTVDFICQANGPTVANAGTLSVITAAVTGWNSVVNPTDAVLGTLQETDTALRLRRQNQLASAGASTNDSIRAALLGVKGVVSAYVFENTTAQTDVNGVPAHAYECVVYDGISPSAANSDIAAAVWKSKPTGIQAFGQTTTTTPDSTGLSRSVSFTRSTALPVYMAFTVTTDSTFPSDGIAQVKAAVAAKGAAVLAQGISVIALTYKAAAQTVQGVIDVPTLTLGFAPSPAGTVNLAVTSRNIAVLDTSRITVNGL